MSENENNILVKQIKENPEKYNLDLNNWAKRMELLKEVHDSTFLKIEKEKEKQMHYFNKCKREVSFDIGEEVWKRNFQLSAAAKGFNAKLAPIYLGPYTIVEKKGENVYRLEKDRKILDCTVHAKDLRKKYEDEWHRLEQARKEEEKKNEEDEEKPTAAPRRKRGRPKKKQRALHPSGAGEQSGAQREKQDATSAAPPSPAAQVRRGGEGENGPRAYSGRTGREPPNAARYYTRSAARERAAS